MGSEIHIIGVESHINLMLTFLVVAGFFALATLAHIVFKYDDKRNMPVWILTVLIFPIIGSIIYWFVLNRDKKQARRFDPFRNRP